MSADGLRASEEKMRSAGAHPLAIAAFRHHYEQLAAGATGLMPESELEPVHELPALDDLQVDAETGREALGRTVVVKLNGGLGTSMGLPRAKSLLTVKDGLTFLDVIARQILALRSRYGVRLPLVLMDSMRTRTDSLALLERYPELAGALPPDFLQHQEPKIRVDDLQPVSWPADPELEWCPPGHGDVYTALGSSGMLDTLLEHGFDYAFISNADNLGAVPDPRILAWLAAERVPFASEQCERTEADRKGGHLARRHDGRLVLRETAQAPTKDRAAFEDIARHRYFNINNLWIDLRAFARRLEQRGGVLALPLIRNEKTVDPTDPDSPDVYQLETAMGAAISLFDGARALRVGRERFAPVKTTDDLLVVRSDNYVLASDYRLVLSPQRSGPPTLVELDPRFYKLILDFEPRFAAGPPSLMDCERLRVHGDVYFGAGVVARGDVDVSNSSGEPLRLADGALLEG